MFQFSRSRVALLLCASAFTGCHARAQFSCIGFRAMPPEFYEITNTIDAPYAVAAGDFNDYGFVDLVVATNSGASSSIFLLPGGLLDAPGLNTTPILLTETEIGRWVEVGDIDGDGHLDVIFAFRERIGVLYGNGDGTFQQPVFTPSIAGVTGSFFNFTLCDLTGDGLPDLLAKFGIGEDIWLFINDGDGFFSAAERYTHDDASGLYIWPHDMTGDGRDEIVYIATSGSDVNLYILRREDTGGMSELSRTRIDPPSQAEPHPGLEDNFVGHTPMGYVVADLNGDGLPDVAIADAYDKLATVEGAIIVMLNDGAGGFEQLDTIYLNHVPWYIVAADLDGDGRLDLITGSAPLYNIGHSIIQNTSVNGVFSYRGPTRAPATGYPRMLLPVDLGGGAIDIVVVNTWFDFVMDLRNITPQGQPCVYDITGDGTVAAGDIAQLLSRYGRPGQLADLNTDGVVDARDLALLLSTWGMAGESPRHALQYFDWIYDLQRSEGAGTAETPAHWRDVFHAGLNAADVARLLATGSSPGDGDEE